MNNDLKAKNLEIEEIKSENLSLDLQNKNIHDHDNILLQLEQYGMNLTEVYITN